MAKDRKPWKPLAKAKYSDRHGRRASDTPWHTYESKAGRREDHVNGIKKMMRQHDSYEERYREW